MVNKISWQQKKPLISAILLSTKKKEGKEKKDIG